MINSMKKNNKLITPENAASFLPIIISSIIGIIIILLFVIPESIKSNKVNLELNEYIRKKDQLPILKLKYKKINQKFDVLNKEKSRIINLISGTTNLETLLANLGIIGRNNNIQFISIVPKNIIIANDNTSLDKSNQTQNLDGLIDPLLVKGLKKYSIDISFKTNFINLQSFLREIESQENLVLIKNIDVKLNEKMDSNHQSEDSTLDIILSMIFYGKI